MRTARGAMTFEQAAILVLLVGMLAVFALDRIRMEMVALGGLAIALLLGLVPMGLAFSGFANPAFITVVEILLIVQVLGRSGLLDRLSARIPGMGLGETGIATILCGVTAVLSVFMNNIGALALMLPIVGSVCRAAKIHQNRMLMPVSFAALLGGLCSVIGTPANLIVSQQLAGETGRAFAFFDFAYAGLPAAAAGLAAVVLWARRSLSAGDEGNVSPSGQMRRKVVAEAVIPESSAFAGTPATGFPAAIHSLRRNGAHLLFQRPDTRLEAGDVILLEAELPTLEGWLADGELLLPAGEGPLRQGDDLVEAVLMPESTLVGSRVWTIEAFSTRGVRIVAVAARTPRVEGSFGDLQLGIGDVLYLRGDLEAVREALEETELLPLWPRPGKPEISAKSWLPFGVFAGGIAFATFGYAPPELAFGLVVLILAASGSLNLRRGLAELDWRILIILAAMIPLGTAVESTGAASVLAAGTLALLPSSAPLFLLGTVLLLAIIVTPFVNNASTAIVLGPIAADIAVSAGLPIEPFLLAVALGASIDFLTPIGHHNNTVVMGLAGYRFADFLKAGWPVTLVAYVAGLLALWRFWFH